MPKDLFSDQSDAYAKYRPTYPAALYEYILQFVPARRHAWDCGTGNGQAAVVLAGAFEQVDATDISEAQIAKAVQRANIRYSVCSAESTPFPSDRFDLITVATAYHWLRWQAFAAEARRVGRAGAVVAVWAYHLMRCADENVNGLVDHFYHRIVGPYWDTERRHVEDYYASVEFPFAPLPTRDFEIRVQWPKEAFLGYLSSWSAVNNYRRQNGSDPLELIRAEADRIWGQETKEIWFPLFLRIGRIEK